jgi:hypothetical protein
MARRSGSAHPSILGLAILFATSSVILLGCGDRSAATTGAASSAAPSSTTDAKSGGARGAAGTMTTKVGPKTTDYPIDKAFVVDASPSTSIVLLSGCPAATCKEASSFKELEALCKDRKAVTIVVEKRPDEGPLPVAKLGKDTSPKAWLRILHLSAGDPDLFFPEGVEITASDKTKLTGKLIGVLPAAPSTTHDFRETGITLSGDFTAEVCPAE